MLQSSLVVSLQVIPEGSRVEVFQSIYWVFLGLGTAVGIVVIGYMLYNAYKYRDDGSVDEDDDRPELGELPTGGGKGRKLFLSFALSAVIVVSLVVWTYGTLLYVENAAAGDTGIDGEESLEVEVVGHQFFWEYEYPNGAATTRLVVPEDRTVKLNVTSADVWHNFGVPEFRVKTDAIPGQYTSTWFIAEETGNYTAQCYELCGSGHSAMKGDVRVMTQENFQDWYADLNASGEGAADSASSSPNPEKGGEDHSDAGAGEGTESIRVPTGEQFGAATITP
jgi:cytochrome c oxidase subunit 2